MLFSEFVYTQIKTWWCTKQWMWLLFPAQNLILWLEQPQRAELTGAVSLCSGILTFLWSSNNRSVEHTLYVGLAGVCVCGSDAFIVYLDGQHSVKTSKAIWRAVLKVVGWLLLSLPDSQIFQKWSQRWIVLWDRPNVAWPLKPWLIQPPWHQLLVCELVVGKFCLQSLPNCSL